MRAAEAARAPAYRYACMMQLQRSAYPPIEPRAPELIIDKTFLFFQESRHADNTHASGIIYAPRIS